MACCRNRTFAKIVDYCKECGIDIKTNTKARGHQGVFLHNSDLKRIDISKTLNSEKFLQVTAHEFAHFFHHTLDKEFGCLEAIFGVKSEILFDELIAVTNYVAGNTYVDNINEELQKIKHQIKEQENIIKQKYPAFKRSEKFDKIEKEIKKSEAKYLLKYDKVKVVSQFKYIIYSLETLKNDFPTIMPECAAYLNLRSLQRRQNRYSRKLNHLRKYYLKPAELFARFVEGLVVNPIKVKELAPEAYSAFIERLEYRSFKQLKGFLNIAWGYEI